MINLLPPQYKMEIKQEENRRLILILEFIFFIFLISLISVLFSVETYIKGQVDSLKIVAELEEKSFQTSENQFLRSKIIAANQNFSKLDSFYQIQPKPTEIFEKISQSLPSGIYLISFSWQEKTSDVSISGFSPNRELLLQFKENLEEREEFTEIKFPPSNWIEPTNINFQVSFKLK